MSTVKPAPVPTTSPAPGEPADLGTGAAHRWALGGILLLALLLYVWAIDAGGFGNAYYSAAVKSMTRSPGNFLFGAFDPVGVVSTDKPPMSLWPQALTVLVFGFHSWTVLLPQAVEGVAAVFLLHRTVRLWAGERVALLAALILTLTPVTVAIDRDNNTDALLVLLLLAAAYAFTRSVLAAAIRSRRNWLLACGFWIGCGFSTKWLEAWILLPGLTLAFLVCTAGPVRRRVLDLLAAGGVLLVSSFWWPVLHDLWPGHTPFVDASTDGSALQVIFGYNGFGKIFDFGQVYNGGGINVALGMVGMGGGEPVVTRMFSPEVGGQISWLLPLSLLALGAVGASGYRRLWFRQPGDAAERAGWLLWGSWLVVTAAVFSFVQGIWHPYYTAMLAPAVAAVSAAGLARLWRDYREASGRGWTLLPLGVALTTAWAFVLVSRDTSWYGWTRWAVAALAALALAGLLLGRLAPGRARSLGRPAMVLAVVSVLFTTAVWSAGTALEHGTNGGFPSAGPPNRKLDAMLHGRLAFVVELPSVMFESGGTGAAAAAGIQPTGGGNLPAGAPPKLDFRLAPEQYRRQPARGAGLGGAELSGENRRALDYAVAHADGAQIALAVEGGGIAAAQFIVDSDATVVGMGGYLGADNVPSVDQLTGWIADGRLRFVLSAAPGAPRRGGIAGMGGEAQRRRVAFVQQHCQAVDPAAYGGTAPDTDGKLPFPSFADSVLYRCG
ncbi:glycosyltransferase family 39 protein [Kitasatospora sp. NPDC049285]|uniref:ArnT family glycosyltransferase n=1 Tax=Kitasatospora sp. NPDC049285 TaxID=3157096 RepID=UPI003431EC6F